MKKPKALCLTATLESVGIRAEGFVGPFEDFARDLQQYPAVVVNGLDNIDVRHEVQRALWPDIVIDGAIGDFSYQVSSHPWPGTPLA